MVSTALADPNFAFLLVVLGALGLAWELHAPGMFLPGILGAFLMCVGAYGLYQDSPTWYGVTLLVVALVLLAIELKYYTHMVSGIAGAILLAFGAMALVQGPRRITPAIAFAVSAALGILTVFLGLLGMRARQNKHMTGIETLVGQIGECRTAIDPQGTVFVNGEYWQARSPHSISAGQRVCVRRVENLTLYVEAV